LAGWVHQFSDWYLSVLAQGGYWLIAGLMALESTVVPIPSEVIIPPAAYLAQSQGQFSLVGVILAGTAGSWLGATIMYWASRWLGRPVVMRVAPYLGVARAKIQMAEAWAARYGMAGVFFSRLLPVIRHLIGVPAGILRMDFRWYSAATLAGAMIWTSLLAWLGRTVGDHPELLKGSLHRFALFVLAFAVAIGALYYSFVKRSEAKT
jgi:membrane protein DedA with SNARE-associated domain